MTKGHSTLAHLSTSRIIPHYVCIVLTSHPPQKNRVLQLYFVFMIWTLDAISCDERRRTICNFSLLYHMNHWLRRTPCQSLSV